MKLTASNLVWKIRQLSSNHVYNYLNPRNKGRIAIVEVVLPEGPIYIKRLNPNNGESMDTADKVPISTEMIARIANAFTEGQLINFDRILDASSPSRR